MGDGWRRTRSGSPISSSCTRCARGTWRTRASSSRTGGSTSSRPTSSTARSARPYTLDRFPALLAAAPRGQFIGNMPVVEFDGDRATGMQHFIFIDQQTHAMRLGWYNDEYLRTSDGWRIRQPRHHLHAQARRFRFRATTRSARRALKAQHDGAPEDHQRRRSRRRAAALVAGAPPGLDARARSARRAGAVGRLLARRRALRTTRR